jgi:hypothetical protein
LTQAQTTSVTLQVTDAGAQAWNNGTWTAVLSSLPGASNYGPPFNIINNGGTVPNQTQTGSLSGTGGASLTATPNSVVTPANSQWKFTVCPQASPVQCYTQFVTVTNTGTQTVTLTPPAIVINLGQTTTNALAYATTEIGSAVVGSQFYLIGTGLQICSVVSGSSCTTWSSAGGGGGITQVSSITNPCTPSTSGPVQLTVGATQDIYRCRYDPTGATAGLYVPDYCPQNAICPQAYGVKLDARVIGPTGCSWSAGTPATVTCPTGSFFPTDCTGGSGCTGTASKTFQAMEWNGNISNLGTAATLVTATTISSYISSTQVTIASAANASVASNTYAIWGTRDTAGWLTTLNADATSLNGCLDIFAEGNTLVDGQILQTVSITCTPAEDTLASTYMGLIGMKVQGLIFVPTTDFALGTCTGLGNSYFFGWQAKHIENVSINGFNLNPGGSHSCSIFSPQTDDNIRRIDIIGWIATDGAASGVNFDAQGAQSLEHINVVTAGKNPCVVTASTNQRNSLFGFCQTNLANSAMIINSGAVWDAFNYAYASPAGTIVVQNNGGIEYEHHCGLASGGNQNNAGEFLAVNGGYSSIEECEAMTNSGTTGAVLGVGSGGTLVIRNNQLMTSTAGAICITANTSNRFVNLGNGANPSFSGPLLNTGCQVITCSGSVGSCATIQPGWASNQAFILRFTATAALGATLTITYAEENVTSGGVAQPCSVTPLTGDSGQTGTWTAPVTLIYSPASLTTGTVTIANSIALINGDTYDMYVSCPVN